MSVVESTGSRFAERLVDEGRELAEAAAERGLALRLMGGVGIRLALGEAFDPSHERRYGDLDVIIRRRDARGVETLLCERGWEPAGQFNALNGARRLLFLDPHSAAQVDVFVDAFEMCHALPLADSLDRPGPSLPATDLLMTKLQIVELNPKDRTDLHAMLRACELRDGDHLAIEPARLAAVTGRDWGVHHTFELNLAKLRGPGATPVVEERVDRLFEVMELAPKSRGWKLRAKVGERKRWYELPEEVDRGADAPA
jgi:hypothetical protein